MKTTSLTFAAVAAAVLSLGAGAASGQQPMSHGKAEDSKADHSKMGGDPARMRAHAASMRGHMAMADKAFMSSMQKMQRDMMSAKGGDVDVAFARKMVAHHQGAIDMARIELEHGADAEARRIAQTTIDENTKGVAALRDWLRRHDG